MTESPEHTNRPEERGARVCREAGAATLAHRPPGWLAMIGDSGREGTAENHISIGCRSAAGGNCSDRSWQDQFLPAQIVESLYLQ
ncbi:hypothetical protein AR543_p0165 (plasmid) [Paenibacillus bovis]|uniref:Uncharacterized protein n=1 Tax=Paenibacillus bovis TaxID=1616788 RepID=A0A1X9T4B6_9BACL|nr:hypothetical protein AR543_p0165 [Paenibacillus bovis]